MRSIMAPNLAPNFREIRCRNVQPLTTGSTGRAVELEKELELLPVPKLLASDDCSTPHVRPVPSRTPFGPFDGVLLLLHDCGIPVAVSGFWQLIFRASLPNFCIVVISSLVKISAAIGIIEVILFLFIGLVW